MTGEQKQVSGGNIIIPTLNVDDLIAPLVEKIISTTKDAEKVNVLNPFSSFFHLEKLLKQKKIIAGEYNIKLKESVKNSSSILLWSLVWQY